MASEHLDTERLLHFLESPDRDAAGCAAHLATCAECRQTAAHLSRMIAALPDALSDTRYDEDWMNEQARAPDTPPARLADRYHYLHLRLSHRLAPAPVALPTAEARSGLIQRIVRAMNSPAFERPWVLAYAVVATLALGVAVFLRTAPTSPALAAYTAQDFLVLEPRNSGMSLGFFDAAQQTRLAYGKVDVQWSNDTLSAAWPEVRGATEYRFDVYAMINGESTSMGHYSGSTPHASMVAKLIEPGRHYQWRLSGMTSDDRQFRIEGGFVLGGGDKP